MTDKIGDPLKEAAQSGMLGGRRPITSKQPAPQASTNTPLPEKKGEQKQPEREKRTLMFPPSLMKWLKVQAALEEREMSEIVADALELYRQRHPEADDALGTYKQPRTSS